MKDSFSNPLSAWLRPLLIASVVMFATRGYAATNGPQTNLPTITLSAGGQTVRADVAATDAARETGLMHREKMGRNEGMLFVFSYVGYHSMWMRNTPLPLSVAFMDEAGRILSIHDMEPFSESIHQAAGPARYALEMHKGWFAQHKVKIGDAVKGLEKAPKPQ